MLFKVIFICKGNVLIIYKHTTFGMFRSFFE